MFRAVKKNVRRDLLPMASQDVRFKFQTTHQAAVKHKARKNFRLKPGQIMCILLVFVLVILGLVMAVATVWYNWHFFEARLFAITFGHLSLQKVATTFFWKVEEEADVQNVLSVLVVGSQQMRWRSSWCVSCILFNKSCNLLFVYLYLGMARLYVPHTCKN